MNRNKLKARIIEMGYTQRSFAEAIGMPYRTFSWKLKCGKFGTDDIKAIMTVLAIDDPVPYFFAEKVT